MCRLCCCLCLFWLTLPSQLLATEKLTVVTEDLWPMQYQEAGELKGSVPVVVKKVLERAGVDYELKVFPWVRAYKLAEEQANVLIFSIVRTKERESRFRWVGQVYPTQRTVLLKRADSDIHLSSLQQAKSYYIASKIGDVNYEFLMEQGFSKLYKVTSVRQCLGMLLKNRVDLVIGNDHILYRYLNEMGHSDQLLSVAYTVTTTHPFMAMGLKTSDKLFQKVRRAYDELVAEGELDDFNRPVHSPKVSVD